MRAQSPMRAALLISIALGARPALLRAQCPQSFPLTAPVLAPTDQFGVSAAVSGDTLIIGANQHDGPAGADQGAAYIYRWTGASWAFEAQLMADDAAPGDYFGVGVAISGDTALIGARFDDGAAGVDQGSAYIFTRSGSDWTQQAKLTASDAALDDSFGSSVAIDGETAIIGSYRDDGPAGNNQGSAYIFVRAGDAWSEQAKLVASDAAAFDEFALSVSISGDTAVVGSYYDNGAAGTFQGSAYIFVRAAGIWSEEAKLLPSDPAALDEFGLSVAICGDTAIVGSLLDDDAAGADQGSAYVFARGGPGAPGWSQQAKLTASNAAPGDRFGHRVALDGDTAIIGALARDGPAGIDQGAAYIFTRAGSSWMQESMFLAPTPAIGDQFGSAVSISGPVAIVGAPFDDHAPGANHGSAVVLHRAGSMWRALGDADGSRTVNFNDALSVLATFGADYSPGTGPGDADGNSLVNFTDIITVLANFGAICP